MIFKTIFSKSISLQIRSELSRRDVTLLTVEFILRTISAMLSHKVPQGRYFEGIIVSRCKKNEDIFKNVRSLLSRRDRILVENIFVRERLRAVRYAIFSSYIVSLTGHTMRTRTHYFYQHFVPNGTSSTNFEPVFIIKRSHSLHLTAYTTLLQVVYF